MKENTRLDPALNLRPAAWEDAKAAADLIYAACEADGDTSVATSAEELEHSWHTEGFDLLRDAFVVETADGRIVGYEEIFNEKAFADFNADGYVHPEFHGRGIGTAMLMRAEERAAELMRSAEPDLRVFIRAATDGKDLNGQAMFKDLGYQPVRHFWRMEINLESAPEFSLPSGIELRLFNSLEDARLIWQADNDAFQEHWGSHAETFEEWSFRKLERPEFDPDLWLVAWAGEQIAGFSQNRFRNGIGWVSTLGVCKPWRNAGLGLALLNASFADFYQRGMKIVGLGVDAANSTGATRLYQRAGMTIVSEFHNFEKELRPGRHLERLG